MEVAAANVAGDGKWKRWFEALRDVRISAVHAVHAVGFAIRQRGD